MKKFLLLITALTCIIFSCCAQIEMPAPLIDRSEIIIHHSGFTLSYNIEHGTPNWSAWVLTRSHVLQDSVARSNTFFADPLISESYRVTPSDYAKSGYDRGHLCPAADMSWSESAMHDCFYMSNMAPQNPALNRVSWKKLEASCRKWALKEDTLYIVCGPVYSNDHEPITIHHEPTVAVPNGFFKVVLSLRPQHEKAIGFYYSNTKDKQSIKSNAKSVDEIEQLSGIDFFYTLNDSLENILESQFNLKDWR